MSSPILVKIAGRKKRRDSEKVLSKELNKYIAEILSNSDDSYKRLEKNDVLSNGDISPIYIEVDKYRREITIIDHAEGMNEDDMRKNFENYGADTSGGDQTKNVRGLFGQGASDVLFSSASHEKTALIQSIKDGNFHTCKFVWIDDNQAIKISTPKAHLRSLREKFGIDGNGTVVRFGLPDSVSISNDLKKSIESFYMFRFILSNSNRNVILKVVNKGGSKVENLKYVFPVVPDQNKLLEKEIEFVFDGRSVKGELLLFSMDQDEKTKYGEQKILVFDDEGNVYDNTFFKFGDAYPGTDKLAGELRLIGTSKIIREYLNKEHPEEILSDSRDGLVQKHDFYKSLTAIIDPLIQKALDDINSSTASKSISLDNNKEWNDAFKEINKYFKETLEENIGGPNKGVDAPVDGLRFVRTQISISAGKTYGVQLLINTSIVPIGSTIKISYDDEPNIIIEAEDFMLTDSDVVDGNLAIKSLSITGVESTENPIQVIAEHDNIRAKLFVNVINKEIHYPKYGLEFWPNTIITKPTNKSKLHLYFDINKYPIGSTVKINSDQGLIVEKDIFELAESDLINDEIGVIDYEFTGGIVGESYIIRAVCNGYETIGTIEVKEFETPPAGSSGFFSGAELKEEDQFWQTFYHPKTGKIIINKGNVINLSQLGDMNAVSNKDPKFSKDQKKYIAEICAFECSKQLAKKMYEKGKIDQNNIESYLDLLQKEKNKIYKIFERSDIF